MTRNYTAADFANARFAEHEDGAAIAVRWTQDYTDEPDDYWVYERPLNNRFSKEATHQEMADMGGWVPVPSKPTITRSEVRNQIKTQGDEWANGYYTALTDFGGEVIEDQEPTNADKLEALLWSINKEHEGEQLEGAQAVRAWAEALSDRGITAPNVKDN